MAHAPALAPASERDFPPAWLPPAPFPFPCPSRFGASDDASDHLSATIAASAALREAAFAAQEAAFRARSLAALLDEALAVLAAVETETAASASPAPLPPAAPFLGQIEPLSRREREVLALVAEGRSNKAIAAALFVSPNTVKTHVTSLLQKLQVGSRVQLAAITTLHALH